uniref:Uncharacterized protein n=1 Tax=Lactuca sativa TaxID=4236 RepID=A0A9R1X6C2_LACSA|nr:hypothetical protein LSAT_V11C700342440 [Lactuca sativa]
MRILIEMSTSKDWLKEVQDKGFSQNAELNMLGILPNVLIVKFMDIRILTEEVQIDLMEVLIASTKKVEEDDEGFQTVFKKNKGKSAEDKVKEESGVVSRV